MWFFPKKRKTNIGVYYSIIWHIKYNIITQSSARNELLTSSVAHLQYSLQESDTEYCRTKKRQVSEKIILLDTLLLDLLKE